MGCSLGVGRPPIVVKGVGSPVSSDVVGVARQSHLPFDACLLLGLTTFHKYGTALRFGDSSAMGLSLRSRIRQDLGQRLLLDGDMALPIVDLS